jgi:acyl-CoA synthetase (NDP forming)
MEAMKDRDQLRLEDVFEPESIAVIGASSANTFGGRSLRYLKKLGFRGAVYPVNPRYESLRDWRCYPSVQALPGDVDVAVIAVAAESTPAVVRDLGARNCRAAFVLSSGFSERGEDGRDLEMRLLREAERQHIRIIGPNCNGAINVLHSIPLGCSTAMDRGALVKGSVALVSQSGSAGASFVDAAMSRAVGFSYVVAVGNANDLDVTDFVRLLATDANTRVITILMEGVRDGRSFIEAVNEVHKRGKSLVVLKIGRSEAGATTAATHTGKIVGSWELFHHLVEDAGGLVVRSMTQLLELTAANASYSEMRRDRPWGTRLQVLSTSGALCGLIVDQISEEPSITLAQPSAPSARVLSGVGFGPPWNPLDFAKVPMGEDKWAGAFKSVVEALASDPAIDGILIGSGLSHIVNEMSGLAVDVARVHAEKLLACYVFGGELLDEARRLTVGPVISSEDLDALIRVLAYRSTSSEGKSPSSGGERGVWHGDDALRSAVLERPTEHELTRLLAEVGLECPPGRLAGSIQEAIAACEMIGFPVVLKISSDRQLHKAHLGLIRTNVCSAAAARDAFEQIRRVAEDRSLWQGEVLIAKQIDLVGARELLVAARWDPTFGLHLVVGSGGSQVEAKRDWVGLLPTAKREGVRRALRRLQMLADVSDDDLEPLERAVRSIELAAELLSPEASVVEVNPCAFWPEERRCLALDARIQYQTDSRE